MLVNILYSAQSLRLEIPIGYIYLTPLYFDIFFKKFSFLSFLHSPLPLTSVFSSLLLGLLLSFLQYQTGKRKLSKMAIICPSIWDVLLLLISLMVVGVAVSETSAWCFLF